MGKATSCFKHVACCSIVLNVLLVINIFLSNGRGVIREGKLSWSRKAAQEAEDVAAMDCSGHGRAYLDGLVLQGNHLPVCECNSCYGGPSCSHFLPNCTADANSGDPYFLEPFWMENAAKSALLVPGWHRMSYSFSDGSFISQVLENYIRKLHASVGNAVTDGRYIIFGAGSAQLLNAAVYSLTSGNSSLPPPRVVASPPYYRLYKLQTELFNSVDYKFEGDASLWKKNATTEFIEFVTSPNNPDGYLLGPVLDGPNVKVIYDRAYYWPHYTPIPAPADTDLNIFSISKLTGHAGSRFGWALIKDEAVYQRMLTYLSMNTMGVSRDTQLRALKLIDVVLAGEGRDIFEFGHNTTKSRWNRLAQVFSKSKRFSLQKLSPQYCTFFKIVRPPTPAYAWVKCEREKDKDCYEVFKDANIKGRPGSWFSADDRYVRLSLIKSQDDFEILLHELRKLAAKEDAATSLTSVM